MQNLCEKCLKPPQLCVCASINEISTKREILILQHPQEPDKLLGTAQIAHIALKNSDLKIGLSWPNIESALNRKTDRSKWAVLYLGSSKPPVESSKGSNLVYLLNKQKQLMPLDKRTDIGGLIVLDGTWSQAKALWWRNAWLSKLKRLVIFPSTPSIYGNLRREPRKEALSTIESLAVVLSSLENDVKICEQLLIPFKELVERYHKRSAK